MQDNAALFYGHMLGSFGSEQPCVACGTATYWELDGLPRCKEEIETIFVANGYVPIGSDPDEAPLAAEENL